jgi:cysteine-rich repeat protein
MMTWCAFVLLAPLLMASCSLVMDLPEPRALDSGDEGLHAEADADADGDADLEIPEEGHDEYAVDADAGAPDDADRGDDDAADADDGPEGDDVAGCGNGIPETGEECDDGNDVDGDGCDAGCVYSCHDPRECDDANGCTFNLCDPVATGQACRFVPEEGAGCDDGLWCTVYDTCDASGSCVGTERACSDESICTADECDDETDACVFPIAPGHCSIGVACYREGADNPATECQWCQPAESATSWTPKGNFSACSLLTTPDRSYDICSHGTCVSPGCGDASCNAPGPNFPIPDTTQRLCYDMDGAVIACPGIPGDPSCATTPLCGQDAQYGWDATHAEPERFTRTEPSSGQPIVTDNVTGLVWQGCVAGLSGSSCGTGVAMESTWDDAVRYCDALAWGGSDKWALPNRYEFQFLHGHASIPPTIFPGTPGAGFCSSSACAGDAAAARYVSCSTGAVFFRDKTFSGAFVRCVRERRAPGPSERFARSGAGTVEPVVEDRATGLVWQGCAAGLAGSLCVGGVAETFSWQEALAYCEGLNWAAAADWRLPSAIESGTILDDSRLAPAIEANAFPATPVGYHWTSTS